MCEIERVSPPEPGSAAGWALQVALRGPYLQLPQNTGVQPLPDGSGLIPGLTREKLGFVSDQPLVEADVRQARASLQNLRPLSSRAPTPSALCLLGCVCRPDPTAS